MKSARIHPFSWLLAISVAMSTAAHVAAEQATLIKNVRIFDGKSDALSEPRSVLVRGNVIERIFADDESDDEPEDTLVIDGGGKTLMPGLIDAHWHAMLVRPTPAEAMTNDVGYTNLLAGAEAGDTLMRGFTTVRDLGGPAFGLKRAIDEGLWPGPRIHPAGAIITVTSGHGDFRQKYEVPRVLGGPLSRMEIVGGSVVAASPDEVRVRAREQLLLGATQIKLTAGGGVASPNSPLDVSTFTEAELRAAVEAAENWGTYVAAHAYTPAAIQRAIAAGVKCIEHGHLMDEETAQLISERGVWLSTQPFPAEIADSFPRGSQEHAKAQEVVAGTDRVYKLAKKYKIKTAFGTDVLFSRQLAQRQGALLASLRRWYAPAEILKMATSVNAQLLELSGKRNPYPGKLGVVEEGALADLILVDGNPLEHIELIADPENRFLVIMKNGVVYKNSMRKPTAD